MELLCEAVADDMEEDRAERKDEGGRMKDEKRKERTQCGTTGGKRNQIKVLKGEEFSVKMLQSEALAGE